MYSFVGEQNFKPAYINNLDQLSTSRTMPDLAHLLSRDMLSFAEYANPVVCSELSAALGADSHCAQ
jgi:hypothetical protein